VGHNRIRAESIVGDTKGDLDHATLDAGRIAGIGPIG
jgi:hypothetical protein